SRLTSGNGRDGNVRSASCGTAFRFGFDAIARYSTYPFTGLPAVSTTRPRTLSARAMSTSYVTGVNPGPGSFTRTTAAQYGAPVGAMTVIPCSAGGGPTSR